MDWIKICGLIAAFCTTISFLPQAIQIIRTKDTSSISAAMYSFFTFGTLMWLIFGIYSHNTPVILANGVTLILAVIILFYKLREKPEARVQRFITFYFIIKKPKSLTVYQSVPLFSINKKGTAYVFIEASGVLFKPYICKVENSIPFIFV